MTLFRNILIIAIWPIMWLLAQSIFATYNENPEATDALQTAYNSYVTLFVVLSIATVFLLLQLKRVLPLRKTKPLQSWGYVTLLTCHMALYYFVCWKFSQERLGLWHPMKIW